MTSIVRAVSLLTAVAALALAGCRAANDYGGSPFTGPGRMLYSAKAKLDFNANVVTVTLDSFLDESGQPAPIETSAVVSIWSSDQNNSESSRRALFSQTVNGDITVYTQIVYRAFIADSQNRPRLNVCVRAHTAQGATECLFGEGATPANPADYVKIDLAREMACAPCFTAPTLGGD